MCRPFSQDPEYIAQRRTLRRFQYNLRRRAEALIRCLQEQDVPPGGLVLDIGTADGLVLRDLVEAWPCRAIGLDTDWRYLQAARDNLSLLVQADGRCLPLAARSVDIVVSTAALKHIAGLDRVLDECRRVLRPGGLLVVIDPTPWGTRWAIRLRHLPRESVFQVLGRADWRRLLAEHGLAVVQERRFMLLPWPFPGSLALEGALRRLGLDGIFLQQLICARRELS